jgi:hypothetical protein
VEVEMSTEAPLSPLEGFVRDYVEVLGGAWQEVEPQVYDVLLPSAEAAAEMGAAGRDILRVAFDPEALPEHPGSQLASFGTPFIDRLLRSAMQHGSYARLYLVGLNLAPHDLAARVRRSLTLTPGLTLHVERARPLHFAQAVYWFEATFISDQKEQEIIPVAIDLHYGREVRHLEQLLDHARLAEAPSQPLPEARRLSTAAAYPVAREKVVRSLAALANVHSRALSERVERQIARMTRYYDDLRSELDDQARRAAGRSDDPSKFPARRAALDREERVRIAELRQKASLRVQLRLLTLAVIQQPKLLLRTVLAPAAKDRPSGSVEMVWDPLSDALEAVLCPLCGVPTFSLDLHRSGQVGCPECVARLPLRGKPVSSPGPRRERGRG